MKDGWYESNYQTIHYVKNGLVICNYRTHVNPSRKWKKEHLIDNLTCTLCVRKKL